VDVAVAVDVDVVQERGNSAFLEDFHSLMKDETLVVVAGYVVAVVEDELERHHC
jgi:hypothetical protein